MLLADNPSGLFFVLNADIICDYPLTKMVEFHKSHGCEGTLVVTTVEDPSRYGVIVANADGKIDRFVEKPTTFVSNKINAGMYLFNADIIKRIPMKPTSIERETFPQMAADKQLYQLELKGHWMDIGQPKDYLIGQNLYLNALEEEKDELLTAGVNNCGIIVHPSATIDPTAKLGPNVVIGANCKIGAGVRISNSTIFHDTVVKPYSLIQGSIIGWKNTIGSWVRITGLVCTAEDVQIADESCLTGTKILPHKPVSGVHGDLVLM